MGEDAGQVRRGDQLPEPALELLGLPLLPVALFLVWAGLVAALALASERGSGDDER